MPLLRDKVGLSFEAAVLKGRTNYLCAHRFEAFEQSPSFPGRAEAARWPILRQWALGTRTGDRAEVDLPESSLTWARLSTTSESCLGGRCPLYESCFVTRARRRAEEADLVVVNHHLFFADLSLRERIRDGVLPRYEAVVFDEAHALEEVATEHFGTQLSSFRLEELARDAGDAELSGKKAKLLSAMVANLRKSAEAFFASSRASLGLQRDGTVRLTAKAFQAVSSEADELVSSLKALSAFGTDSEEPVVAAISRRAAELSLELSFVRESSSLDHVYWGEARGRGVFLRAAPIDVSQEMRRRLYAKVDTAVFTSATLTARGSFDFFESRMGLVGDGPPSRTLSVDSPFDFSRQAALYLPSGLPEPTSEGFSAAVAEELYRLAVLMGGCTFALFTSLRQMEAVHALLARRLPFQVLLQGERPKSALLEAFKREPSVLFASHSFWEGVDVPGSALSLVAIDRLPFASPSDPLVAARIDRLRARGQDAFACYQVPQATILLRQGFGRLIRSRKDRGVVALLDRRVTQKAYGRAFLDSLPPAKRLSSFASLADWVRGANASSPSGGRGSG